MMKTISFNTATDRPFLIIRIGDNYNEIIYFDTYKIMNNEYRGIMCIDMNDYDVIYGI